MNLASAPRDALHKPLVAWLVEDATQCPRCHDPRDAQIGGDR